VARKRRSCGQCHLRTSDARPSSHRGAESPVQRQKRSTCAAWPRIRSYLCMPSPRYTSPFLLKALQGIFGAPTIGLISSLPLRGQKDTCQPRHVQSWLTRTLMGPPLAPRAALLGWRPPSGGSALLFNLPVLCFRDRCAPRHENAESVTTSVVA
jgi:hypothetical protein